MLASPLVNSSIPLVFSIIATSTVTPVTIRMTPHGIARMAFFFVGGAHEDEQRGNAESCQADVHTGNAATPRIKPAMPASVSQCAMSMTST